MCWFLLAFNPQFYGALSLPQASSFDEGEQRPTEISTAATNRWKVEALYRLRGDSTGSGSAGFGTVANEPATTTEGVEVEEDRKKIMELRRKLAACPSFDMGQTFNEIGGDCSMSTTVHLGTGDQLRIRGASGLFHPALDRGGRAPDTPGSVQDRHFVLTGTAKIILFNLELKGACVVDGPCDQ